MHFSLYLITCADTDGKKRDILIICLSLVIGLVLLGVVFLLYAWRRKKINIHLRETGKRAQLISFVVMISKK